MQMLMVVKYKEKERKGALLNAAENIWNEKANEQERNYPPKKWDIEGMSGSKIAVEMWKWKAFAFVCARCSSRLHHTMHATHKSSTLQNSSEFKE